MPGAFVLLFFIAALLVKRYRILFVSLALLFYLASTYYVGNKLVRKLEQPYNKPLQETPVNGVVVLGGGHYKGSSNLPLEEGSFKRLVYGIMIAKKHHLPIIYAGADYEIDATQESIKEMNEALDLNLTTQNHIFPKFSILYTENALNTQQNAQKSYQLFADQNITHPKIYLVTSATHMRRAKALFESYGMEVIPAATDFKTRSDSCYCFYYPTTSGLRLTNIAVHELLGSLRDQVKSWFQ